MKPYEIQSRNRFLEAVDSITSHEINPKSKVTFLSLVDLTEVESIRAEVAALGHPKPSYTAFVVKALALALREHPYANRRVARSLWPPLLQPRLQQFNDIDVTVAVERKIEGAEMAAFVDVVRHADHMPIPEIQERLRELAESDAASNRQWREYSTLVTRFPRWLSGLLLRLPLYFPNLWVKYRGAAAMVSSPGKYGVDIIFANWWAPLAVSFGVVKKRPIVQDDEVLARQSFVITVNFDVRVMAGAQAAMFGRRFIDILERPREELTDHLGPVNDAKAD